VDGAEAAGPEMTAQSAEISKVGEETLAAVAETSKDDAPAVDTSKDDTNRKERTTETGTTEKMFCWQWKKLQILWSCRHYGSLVVVDEIGEPLVSDSHNALQI
jgi:hypothetical protein